jgi:hypothetical protein
MSEIVGVRHATKCRCQPDALLHTRQDTGRDSAVLRIILVAPAQYLMNPQTHPFPTFGPTKWAYFFHPLLKHQVSPTLPPLAQRSHP